MKIDVILTGGTIGSKINASGNIDTIPSACKEVDGVSLLTSEKYDGVSFSVSSPYTILSENISAKNIMQLADEIRRLIAGGSAGIIITHGTDTIQYTASLLQYMFGDADIPIVLVSAAYILDDPRSNGWDNFRCAVSFVKNGCGKGVFVSYKNSTPDNICFIHRGNRLLSHMMYSDALYSVCDSFYGRYIINDSEPVFEKNPGYRVREENVPSIQGTNLSEFSDKITVIKAFPGMCIPRRPSDSTKVVLIESFHSGTIPTWNESLRLFCDSAKHLDIPVYLTGLPENEKHYETISEYRALDIVPLKTMSGIAAYCKLWLILSNGLDLNLMNDSVSEDLI